MKIKKLHILLFSSLMSFLLLSCNKEEILPDLEGSLVGYVYLFDEFGVLLEDQSDATITALGMKQYKTFTDESGRFEFKNLPAGTYELHFEKAGFGTLKQFGIQHAGGKPTILGLSFDRSMSGSAYFLYQMQHTEITGLTVENDTIIADLSFVSSKPSGVILNFYFSDESGFSISMAKYRMTRWMSMKENNQYTGALYPSTMPFESGQEIFFKAFAITQVGGLTEDSRGGMAGIDTYFDFETNSTIYPNQGNESTQYSFVLSE